LNVVSDNCYYTTNTPHPPEIEGKLFILYAVDGGTRYATRLSDVPANATYVISSVVDGDSYVMETPIFFDLTAKLTSPGIISEEIKTDMSNRYFDKVTYLSSDELDMLYTILSSLRASPWERLMELAVQVHLKRNVRRSFIRPPLKCR
jgi:hypothetical protein